MNPEVPTVPARAIQIKADVRVRGAIGGLYRLCADLSVIEIEPFGLGIHLWRIDADLYVPALLKGILGPKSWMAARLGAAGGLTRAAAPRVNGKRGGRPRKAASSL
jgi:hypothetical protein